MPAFPMDYLRRIASSNGGAASDAPKASLITSNSRKQGRRSSSPWILTVHFNQETECAHVVVAEVLELYEGQLGKLPESERSAIQRDKGLIIEQLKVELQQLDE